MSETSSALRVARRFAAAPERVFDAWLDPERARRWLFATAEGVSVRAAIDARVGGGFSFVERRDGVERDFTGEYLVLERPRRLVFTLTVPYYPARPTRVSVEIEACEGGCELTLLQEGVPAEYEQRSEGGWNTILGGLAATLAMPSGAITLERRLPHAPERVWHMLTDSASIAKWLMPNDFAAVQGHRFTLRAPCATEWDGVIRCEVLEIDPPRRLRYSWVSGTEGEAGMSAPLDSWVSWTLEPVQGGTMLRMEHAGFGPGNETVHAAVTQGWPGKLDLLDGLLAEG